LTVSGEMLRRLKWRSRRGLLENDLLLERFFEKWESQLTREDHDGLAMLFDLPDNELLELLVGKKEPQDGLDLPEVKAVIQKIRAA
jgi:antitoxin CptB